jgi:hypothetical protein
MGNKIQKCIDIFDEEAVQPIREVTEVALKHVGDKNNSSLPFPQGSRIVRLG